MPLLSALPHLTPRNKAVQEPLKCGTCQVREDSLASHEGAQYFISPGTEAANASSAPCFAVLQIPCIFDLSILYVSAISRCVDDEVSTDVNTLCFCGRANLVRDVIYPQPGTTAPTNLLTWPGSTMLVSAAR